MKPVILDNVGYIETNLSKEKYNSLLKECLNKKPKKKMTSGLTNEGVPNHYYITDKKNLHIIKNVVSSLIEEHKKQFPLYIETFNFLKKDVSFYFRDPWINFQKQNEFFPLHNHDGVYSYNIWIKIPYDSTDKKYSGNFEFIYNSTLGKTHHQSIKLSNRDEGKIILFPSALEHLVYPFYSNNKTRMSISGNVCFDV